MVKLQQIVTLLFAALVAVSATRFNYPRVLLPIFSEISINFTLEATEVGCFKWTSSRQDLILITPITDDSDGECSYRATVTVLTREKRRSTAIVLAEDLSTGESLRCDVILDVIDKLGVHTTTRQLYLEEAPETFELRAEDSQGNAFTTLEGIEFNWAIAPLNRDNKGFSLALRFLSFTESAYHEVPPALEKFEANGIKGYMVLLEGINTGTAKVTVSIPHMEYGHVPGIEVYINVLANIILEPSDVHMLVGDTIPFRILQLKMGKLQEISLNDQYFLEIDDSSIAGIRGKSASALKLGRTSVVLRDRNAPSDGNFFTDNVIAKSAIPSAQLTVCNPHSLGLSLLPHNNWVTVEGEKHEIALDLYTIDDQKITLGSRYAITSELDEMIFYIFKQSQNGSRLFGEAIKEGVSQVYGSYMSLNAQAQLQVFSELLLSPTKVILPYDPNVVKTQKLQFTARGGDGSYLWHAHNSRVIQINQNGVATTVIQSSPEGKYASTDSLETGALLTTHASVRVALARNPKISRQADIYFLPPVKLEILQYNFETALKDFVRLHVAVYAYANDTFVPFTRCENLIFDLAFSNQIFQVDYAATTAEIAPGACQVLHLRSTALGMTHLRLTYKFQDKVLRDEVTLSVFEPITVFNPLENEVILPIGASRNVIYANGPQQIFTLETELKQSMVYDRKVVTVGELHRVESAQHMYVFNVLCRKVGQTTISFNIYHTLAASNFKEYVSHLSTVVYCVKPRFLNLYASEQVRTSCPLDVKSTLMHLKEGDDKFEIEIEVQDAKNRRLMNISSLHIDWEFGAGEVRYRSDAIRHHRQSEEELFAGVRLPVKDVLVTTITVVLAHNFRIKGVVDSYDEAVLRQQHIVAEEPFFGIKNLRTGEESTPLIENEIRFMAVNSTLFPKDHISVFMAKNRQERIPIAQGSGFYDFQLLEQGVVSVEFEAKQRELKITPLRIGHARLELIDRCLMTEPAVLSISVVSMGAIRVHGADRVERTKSIEAIVRLYDSNDNLLHVDPSNLSIYELTQEVFNAEILSVKLGDQADLGDGEIRYIVTGNNLGETKIIFHSGSGALQVSSQPLNIQVFPPLRLYPRNSTLVVGSSVQIYYLGGPQPNVNIVYYVHDKKVIDMESAIVTALKLGATQITGSCMMTNSVNGRDVIISEDTIELHVVPLLTIQIKTPLIRIRSGAVMPAAVWGLPDLSPMVLGTLENMKISWSTNQPDVVDIYNIFADAGIEYTDSDMISVRVKALNPGKATIKAIAELPNKQKLTATVDVVVFKKLELETPKLKLEGILVAPRSSIQLKANLDDAHYKLDGKSKGFVTVTNDGLVRTQDTLGRGLIIAETTEQRLTIGVEVKNVQYILTRLEYPTIKLKQSEAKIPRGTNFLLKVSLHDNLGNEFSHNIDDFNGIKCELAHKDIVDVQIGNNMTIAINLPRETSNMIAISLKDTTGVKHAEDYIKLSVAESPHIHPTKTIFCVGDVICFDSPLAVSSPWTSSDEKIVSIDKYTGIARVLGNRYKLGEKIVVTNGNRASGSFIKYDVEVRDADVIDLLKSFDIFSGSSYRGHLVVRNHQQLDKFTNLVAQNLSKCAHALGAAVDKLFSCRLTSKQPLGQQLLKHYKATPVFEAETGRYACQIDLLASFNEILNIVKTNDVLFELEALLPNGLADSLSLKFVPGVKVTPESLFAHQLQQQELIITGLDKVLQKIVVKPSNDDLLKVQQHMKAHGQLNYRITQLSEMPPEELVFVHVHSPATQQQIDIPVLGDNSLEQKCLTSFGSSSMLQKVIANIGLVITILVVLVVTVWVFVSCGPQQGKAADINDDAFASSISNQQNISMSSSGSSSGRPISPISPITPLYPNLSPYFRNRSGPSSIGNLSPGSESQVYGDATLISPQKRINRRYL